MKHPLHLSALVAPWRAATAILCAPLLGAALLAASPGAGASTTETFGGPGGSPFVSTCPAHMAMVGIRAATGAWVDAVAPLCGRLDPATGKVLPPWWRHKAVGGHGGDAQERVCDDGHPLTGLALTHTIGHGLDRQYVNSIGLYCDRQDRIQQCIGSGEGCALVSKTTTTSAILTVRRTRTYRNDALLCSKGEVVLGMHGRAGSYVDAIGLWCGPPPAAGKP